MTQPPEWFNIRADQPSLWATDVRVSAEGVDFMARLWASPITSPLMRYLWSAFLSSEAHFRGRLSSVDWASRFTPWQLIQFLHVGAGVDQGIVDCVPDLPDLPRGAKTRIYFHALLIAALRYGYESGVPLRVLDSEGEVPAVRWAVMKALSGAVCYAMAPFVARELRRRGDDHVGYAAALLELSRRAENLVPLFGVPNIESLTTRPLRRGLEKRLKKKGLDYWQIQDFLEGLEGQAAITAANKWGDVDPLELLGRALAGELNIAPLAIQDDAVDAARPAAGRRQFEVSFEARREDSPGWNPPDSDIASPETEAEFQALLTRLARDPKLWRYLLAEAAADSQGEAAKALGVSDRMVRNYRKHLETLLRQ